MFTYASILVMIFLFLKVDLFAINSFLKVLLLHSVDFGVLYLCFHFSLGVIFCLFLIFV